MCLKYYHILDQSSLCGNKPIQCLREMLLPSLKKSVLSSLPFLLFTRSAFLAQQRDSFLIATYTLFMSPFPCCLPPPNKTVLAKLVLSVPSRLFPSLFIWLYLPLKVALSSCSILICLLSSTAFQLMDFSIF